MAHKVWSPKHKEILQHGGTCRRQAVELIIFAYDTKPHHTRRELQYSPLEYFVSFQHIPIEEDE